MATVLKQQSAAPVSRGAGLAAFNLSDLAECGHRQIAEARRAAESILATARAEAETIREAAAQEGRKAGLVDAQRQIRESVEKGLRMEVDARMPAIEQAVQELWDAEAKWLDAWGQRLMSTAVAVAEQLVRGQLQHDQQIIQRWVQESIDLARASRNLTVRLHPDTLARCRDSLEQLASAGARRGDIALEADPTVSPAGVVVTSESGEVDSQLDSQLERLKVQLGLAGDAEGSSEEPSL